MKGKLRKIVSMLLCFLMMMQTACGVTPSGDKIGESKEIIVELYYMNPCASCKEDAEFEQAVRQELEEGEINIKFEFRIYNVFREDDMEHMKKRNQEYGWELSMNDVPAAIVDGKLYLGTHQEIGEQLAVHLAEDNLGDWVSNEENTTIASEEKAEEKDWFEEFTVEKDEATIVYFYRVDCQECIDVQPFIDSLPSTISVNGDEVTLNLIRLNSREGNNGERIRALFAKYDVPSEDQMVPFIFLTDKYLAGQKEIEENLLQLLEQGHGQGFSF